MEFENCSAENVVAVDANISPEEFLFKALHEKHNQVVDRTRRIVELEELVEVQEKELLELREKLHEQKPTVSDADDFGGESVATTDELMEKIRVMKAKEEKMQKDIQMQIERKSGGESMMEGVKKRRKMEKELAELEKILEDSHRDIRGMQTLLEVKDAEIARLQKELEERDEEDDREPRREMSHEEGIAAGMAYLESVKFLPRPYEPMSTQLMVMDTIMVILFVMAVISMTRFPLPQFLDLLRNKD